MQNFSPSLYHKQLIKAAPLKLSFRGGDPVAWQRKLKRKILHLIGGIEKKCIPLKTKSLWKRKHKLGTIEKIVFKSENLVDVPAYVCLPEGAQAPYQFLYACRGIQQACIIRSQLAEIIIKRK